ncbi:MAG: nuclear transport factor 2 family protein [Rhizobiales bacterium TMED83]|nr:hypothetical protein [Rhodobiaceae bacterium]RPF93018.1 MAG: nuclear transport factor 2 family protein [Rhizobiales bacterium TMED83]|tara:strand:+ start:580 stop:975 length:396 start_codon:yes stop_codon:yes gene_type:complete
MRPRAIENWHHVMHTGDVSTLSEILHDDAIFHSPVVHTPQIGKAKVMMYLTAATSVFDDTQFTYTREIFGDGQAMLEFSSVVDGIEVNGVDIVSWDADDQITDFKVMVRPVKAVNKLWEKMGEMLELQKSA